MTINHLFYTLTYFIDDLSVQYSSILIPEVDPPGEGMKSENVYAILQGT